MRRCRHLPRRVSREGIAADTACAAPACDRSTWPDKAICCDVPPTCGEGTKLNTAMDGCELAKKCDFTESTDTLGAPGGSLVGAKPAIAALAAAVFALLILGPHPP